MSIWLVMQAADGSERQFSLRKPRTVIGRETTCDVRVPIPSVARKHCEIVIEQGLGVGDQGLEDEQGLGIRNQGLGANAATSNPQPLTPNPCPANPQPLTPNPSRPISIRLTDLGSEQGTYHNGVRVVREAALSHADTLVIGPVTFIVRVDASSDLEGVETTEIVIERIDGAEG